jgi:hypothetical protein
MTASTLRRRLAELERDSEARLPDDAREREELWSWVPVPEREALEIEMEAVLAAVPVDSNAMLAAELKLGAALLLAQKRRDDGQEALT